MRSSIALRFFLLSLCTVGNDSFKPLWSKPFQNRRTHYYAKDKDDSSPHPPANPPPESLLDQSGAFFASSDDDTELAPAAFPPTPTDESKPTAAELWFQANVTPLFDGNNSMFDSKIQPGVPLETIKGAAIAGAALTFLASKGIIVSSAAGLSAAYVAISQGQSGDAMRTAGKVAWDVSETAANLLQKASENTQFAGLTKGIAEKLILASQKSREAQRTLEASKEMGSGNVTESELESEQASEELERVLKEAENAIDAADAAIQTADETLVDDDLINVLEQEADKLEEDARIAEEEARVAEEEEEARVKAEEKAEVEAKEEEEARLKAEEEGRFRVEEEARLEAEEEGRLLAEEAANVKLKAEEEEEARLEAEEESRLLAEEAANTKLKAEEEEEARLEAEEESRVLAEEAANAQLKAEEEAKLQVRLEAEEESRLLAEEAAKEAARIKAEEDARLEEEEKARLEEEARLVEEKRLAKEAEDTEDYDDEWEAAVKLAQQGIEGKIVGIDEAVTDDDAKADWDAAGLLAQELEQGASEDFDEDEDEEVDMAALGQAAREAVAMFEKEMREKEAKKKEVRDDWAGSMVVDGDDDDDDFDLLPEGDIAEIARAARAAVELAENKVKSVDEDSFDDVEAEEVEDEEDIFFDEEEEVGMAAAPAATDWSILKVSELKIALKSRGLTPVGKKADLIAMMEESDIEKRLAVNFEDDDSDLDDEEVDMEELGRQARAAVQMFEAQDKAAIFEAEEPSDEVLMRLENEGLPLFDDDEDGVVSGDTPSENYGSMTVAELKDELRRKGLRVSGKKAELIHRLQAP